jgi:hypothetical protein
MKQIVCVICAAGIMLSTLAQPSSLCITTDKTTSLIFPFSIKHVDRGTKDVLVQPVKEVDNILLVKAATNNFSETNLSVVTGDGSVYSFAICYGNPEVYIYHLPAKSKIAISTYANGILDNPKTMHGIKDGSWDMFTSVTGIFIKENVIYYQLDLENQSPIDYDIDFLRFYIRDKKKSKRTAIQENELTPLYIAGNTKQVKATNRSIIVVALEKFTIPDAKFLAIEVGEKNGGRRLFMTVKNKNIIKANRLPDLH